MYQSLTGDAIIPEELLWKNTPPDKVGNIDHLIEVVDWEANTDPNFAAHHFRRPKPVRSIEQMRAEGYQENWITYDAEDYSAKELTEDRHDQRWRSLRHHPAPGPWQDGRVGY